MNVPRWFVGVLVLAGRWSAATAVAAGAPGTIEAPVDAGDVVVVAPTNADEAVDAGGSATPFTLRLPDGSTCPGDSKHDQWRIQSFVVDPDVDPATLHYDLTAPSRGGYALYGVDTRHYAQRLTYANEGPGQPGRIPPIDPLSFSVFPPGTLASGTYRIGVACTYFRDTAKFWDALIEVTEDAADEPGQMTWRAIGPDGDVVIGGGEVGDGGAAGTSAPGGDSGTGPWVPIAVAGSALVVLAIVARTWINRRGGAGAPAPAKEKELV